MPESEKKDEHDATVLCDNCGTMIEFTDVRMVLLGMHLAYNCPSTQMLREP